MPNARTSIFLAVVCTLPRAAVAQETTSRVIPFTLSTLLPADTTQEVSVELWDAAAGGNLIFVEDYIGPNALSVDSTGSINIRFGSLHQPEGLNPDDFLSGSSRYLDVTQGGVSVLLARLPLTAVAFALSPGPEGPPGPPGPNDVPGNLTMMNSTATAGNLIKGGVPFLHNFGAGNTFLGANAGNLTMTGDGNTATGFNALTSNAGGYSNTAIGYSALSSNTTGLLNTATGAGALQNNTRGTSNTAVGRAALFNNSTGGSNTAVGEQALGINTGGDSNTAIGYSALVNNTTGAINTAVGQGALGVNSTGVGNTAVGAGALSFTQSGNYNTAIGRGAQVLGSALSNSTAIGHDAVADASNKIRLGDAAVTVIEGQVPYTYTSDRNEKENFRGVDPDEVLNKLRGLSVTSWNYKGQDAKQFRHYGPVAQDFFAAFGHDALGTIGTPTTISSGDLDGILMIAAQALEWRTVKQQEEIAALKAENAELKTRLKALERKVK